VVIGRSSGPPGRRSLTIGLRRADIKCEFQGSRVSDYVVCRSMRGPLSGYLDGARPAAAEPGLEGLSEQPWHRHRRDGSARGADDRLSPLLSVLIILGRHPLVRQRSGSLESEAPRHQIRDRDAVYDQVVIRRLKSMGIRERPTAVAAQKSIRSLNRVVGADLD
jgi:hypothetical protein